MAKTIYRKQESVMTRLRIGHTWITHSYLLKKEDQPFCHACHSPFTMKHVLIECSDFTNIRNKFYATDIHTLFREIDISKITEYLKRLGLRPYDTIWSMIYQDLYIHLIIIYRYIFSHYTFFLNLAQTYACKFKLKKNGPTEVLRSY